MHRGADVGDAPGDLPHADVVKDPCEPVGRRPEEADRGSDGHDAGEIRGPEGQATVHVDLQERAVEDDSEMVPTRRENITGRGLVERRAIAEADDHLRPARYPHRRTSVSLVGGGSAEEELLGAAWPCRADVDPCFEGELVADAPASRERDVITLAVEGQRAAGGARRGDDWDEGFGADLRRVGDAGRRARAHGQGVDVGVVDAGVGLGSERVEEAVVGALDVVRPHEPVAGVDGEELPSGDVGDLGRDEQGAEPPPAQAGHEPQLLRRLHERMAFEIGGAQAVLARLRPGLAPAALEPDLELRLEQVADEDEAVHEERAGDERDRPTVLVEHRLAVVAQHVDHLLVVGDDVAGGGNVSWGSRRVRQDGVRSVEHGGARIHDRLAQHVDVQSVREDLERHGRRQPCRR